MKKKILLVSVCVVLLGMMSSCNFKYVAPAIGLWQGDTILIDFSVPEDDGNYYRKWYKDDGRYYGKWYKDDEEIDILVCFSQVGPSMDIFDLKHEGTNVSYDMLYFAGRAKVENDKIYYTLLPHFEEMYGVKEIVFTKCSEDD